jgi:hypothetical protein
MLAKTLVEQRALPQSCWSLPLASCGPFLYSIKLYSTHEFLVPKSDRVISLKY